MQHLRTHLPLLLVLLLLTACDRSSSSGIYREDDSIAIRYGMPHSEWDEDYFLADAFIRSQQFDSALQIYQRLVQLEPRDMKPHAYVGLGSTHFLLKDYGSSLAAYQEAYKIDPKDPVTCSAIGGAYYYLNQMDSSIHYGREALLLDPDFVDAHYTLAISYSATGQDSLMRVHGNRYLELNPDGNLAWVVQEMLQRPLQ